MEIGIRRVVAASFDETLARLPEALKTEGFGVLTNIDITGTLKQKIGVDFRRYRILGACNPGLAHQALSETPAIGTMLPCNVAVYEDGEHTIVVAVDPLQTIAASDPNLKAIASTVREKLARALSHLG